MNVHPVALTPALVESTITLVESIFPYESRDNIRLAVGSSIDPQLAIERTKKWDCPWNCYWVVLGNRSQVIGVTGLYELDEDRPTADWIGWFGVAPEARGQGLGTRLLRYTIDQARQRQKRYLRLYTSDHPNEAQANTLYERHGFPVFRTERDPESSLTIRYRQLELARYTSPEASVDRDNHGARS